MVQDAVLCVGAGLLQMALLREAKALGLYVIATDGNPNAPGQVLADHFVAIDTYDIPAHEHLVANNRLDSQRPRLRGVVTAGADVAPTVAAAAAAARLPGIPMPVAERSHNKAKVRDAVVAAGLQCYQPNWMHWCPGDDERSLQEAIEAEIGYPCVVKPLQERASRGVTLVATRADLNAALQKAFCYGPNILIEAQLQGTEHSVEAILYDQQLLWFNVVDRYFTYDQGIPLEIGHVNPTRLSLLQRQQLELMLRLVAGVLGVTWGPFKMDVLWTKDGPKLLEATCRMSGGWDCQRTSPLTGRYPLRTLLQVACQLPLEANPVADGYAACAAILPQREGVLQQLPTFHRPAPLVPGNQILDEIIWCVTPGDPIQLPEHCAQRPGFVTTWSQTYDGAWGYATEVARVLAERMVIV